MVIEVLTLVASLLALIMAGFALWMSLDCRISVEGQKRSTHNIQFVPVDQMPSGLRADDDTSRRKAGETPIELDDPMDLGDDVL